MPELRTVTRVDVFDELKFWLQDDFTETKEGYLTGRAIVTNTGIFNYMDAEGNITRELRPDEEVFSEDSLRTLSMIPITNDHPAELVNKDNAKDLQKGFTGQFPIAMRSAVSIPITITDAETIQQIKDGKRALSCGYTADLEMKSGHAFGNNAYDAIQRNIRYNHIAVVDMGRAGDLAKIPLKGDGIAYTGIQKDSVKNADIGGVTPVQIKIDQGDNMPADLNLKAIKIDSIEYQAEKEVIQRLDSLEKQNKKFVADIEELTKTNSEITAKHDAVTEQLEKLKKDSENKIDKAELEKAVQEKLVLLKVAEDAEIELKDGMSDEEIRKAVILKVSPYAKLDGKDETYLKARFDSAVEMLKEFKNDSQKVNVFQQPTVKKDRAGDVAQSMEQYYADKNKKRNGGA